MVRRQKDSWHQPPFFSSTGGEAKAEQPTKMSQAVERRPPCREAAERRLQLFREATERAPVPTAMKVPSCGPPSDDFHPTNDFHTIHASCETAGGIIPRRGVLGPDYVAVAVRL